MAKSSKKRPADKPEKPHKDFPLFPHSNGSWAKKVLGKLHYFGGWSDPDAALNEWLRTKDDLLAGHIPRAKDDEGLTIKRLADTFLTAKRRRVDSGELSPHTYRDYVVICQSIADHFGKNRLVSHLRPVDFASLRVEFSKKHGAYRTGKDVRVTRMLFKFGLDNDLIQHVVKFGSEFVEPGKKSRRRAKRAGGKKYFEAAELRTIINASPPVLKAMVLLAINAGLGNTDVAELRESNIAGGWLNFPRVKTEVERRCPLWPETLEAIADSAEHSGEPKDPANSDLVFCTRFGAKWVRLNDHDDPAKRVRVDSIAQELRKVLKATDINGRRGFYAIRHSHRTAAGETRDKEAADRIMGHSDSSMADAYTHHISDERLQAVVDTVHHWLFGA